MTKPDAPDASDAPDSGGTPTPQGNAPAWVDDVLNASRAGSRPPASMPSTSPPAAAQVTVTPPASSPVSTTGPEVPSGADDLRLPDDLPIPQGSRFDPDDWVLRATGGQVKDPAVPQAGPQAVSQAGLSRPAPHAPAQATVADHADPWAPRTDAWGEALPTPLPPSAVTTQPLDRYAGPAPLTGDVAHKRLIAGLLAIFLGAFGVHKFFLGLNAQGLTLLGVHLGTWVVALILGTLMFIVGLALTIPLALLVSSALGVFGLVEGLILLTKSDADFQREYLIGKKPWL